MNRTVIRFQKLDPRAVTPTYGTADAAGADLYAVLDEPLTIEPHQTRFAPIGIAVEIPQGMVGLIYARSGLACKRGLAPANKVGVIDADYRGEIMVALANHSDVAQTVEPGERIAQMVITPFVPAIYEESESLSDTDRGEGGFGSTGRK